MSFILTKNAGVPVKYLIEGYVEQDTDRAQLRTDYTLGSKIKVIETGKTYVLTENGWKYLEESSFDPSILDDYYTKEETDELIAALNSFVYVDTLPTENIKTNVIYLVPAEEPGDDDIKDEYLNLDGTSAGWERIGSTKIDLTQYYTKTEVDAKFVEKEAGKGLSTNDYTTAEKTKLSGIATGAEVNVQVNWNETDTSSDAFIQNKPTLGSAAAANVTDFATAAQGVKADNAETKNTQQDSRLDAIEEELVVKKTVSGNIVSVHDAAAYPAEELEFAVEPVQDLHGYDKPWPAGGGKNLLQNIATSGSTNGITYTVSSDGTVTVSGTATATAYINVTSVAGQLFPAGTYVLNGCPSGGSMNTYNLYDNSTNVDTGNGVTFTLAEETAKRVIIRIANGATVNNLVFKPMIRLATDTDPTFAPYSNECPISGWTGVNGERTGANVWDEEWRNGFYDASTGAYSANANYVANKNPIIVKPNSTYYFGFPLGKQWAAFWYDANGTFISRTGMYATNPTPLTSPANAAFVNFYMNQDYGTTYNHDISINYPATGTIYHPYTGTSIPITFPTEAGTVYGGKVDVVNGKLTAYPEYDSYNGETLTGEWISSMDAYVAGTTPTIGAQVVDLSGAGTEYDITPQQVQMLLGDNNIWCDTGNTTLTYYSDSTISQLLADLDSRADALESDVSDIENNYLQKAGGALTGDVTTSNTTFVDASLVPKSYVDEHSTPYWEGTRAEYEALVEPLPEGTYVWIIDENISYNDLTNKPQINGTTLTGNKSASDLGLAAADEYIPNAGNSESGNLSITRAGNISLDAELGNFTIGGRTVRLAADSSVVLESDGATITLDGANAAIETYDGAFTVTTDEDTVMVKASEIADTEENIITWDYALFNQDAVAVLRPAFDASNDTLADIVDVWDEIIEHNLKSQLIYENLTINIDADAIFAERTYDADCCDTIFKNCYWLFDGEVTPAITIDLQDGNYIFDNVNFSCESAVTLRIRGGATAAFKNCTFRNVNVIAMADAIVSIDSCKSDGSIKLESDSISANRVIKQLTNTTTAQLIINIDVNTTGTCKEILVYNNRWTTFSNIGTGTIDSSLIYSNNLDAIIGDINSILEEVL